MRIARVVLAALLVAACGGDDDGGARGDGGGADGDGGGDAGAAAFGCPALPAPEGNVIDVTPDQADELPDIVRGAATGDTISLADGTYSLPATLQMAVAGVTLRSASDDPAAVILDASYTVAEAVQVSASDVTIAHLTITRAVDHPVHVVAPDGGRTSPASSSTAPASSTAASSSSRSTRAPRATPGSTAAASSARCSA